MNTPNTLGLFMGEIKWGGFSDADDPNAEYGFPDSYEMTGNINSKGVKSKEMK